MNAVSPHDTALDLVRWHDLECGGYDADRSLWLTLAADRDALQRATRILDLGCGTGRVSLMLASAGHSVLGVDIDGSFCTELRRRASLRSLPVATAVADAQQLQLHERFGLIVAPMQTIQLLAGADGRRAMLAGVRDHLADGGIAAIAIVEDVEPFGPDDAIGLAPDMKDYDGTIYASRPVGVTVADGRIALDRIREIIEPSGERRHSEDRTMLDVIDADQLEAEAVEVGLRVLPRRIVEATTEHVGSRVVMLGA